MTVRDLVNKFEFLSYNKPIIMTFPSDKQVVKPSGYMEECHLKGQSLSGDIHPCIHQVRQFVSEKSHDNGCLSDELQLVLT